jgi:DNA-binding transcriptional MerR regulator/methylmalonyl-CoA mutase cobalamin-binding subunit
MSVQDGLGDKLVSIGELANATGISADTIRVWERRYGRPVPVRLASGHRRYTEEHLRWLRRVGEALALGHRPASVVRLSDGELDALLSPRPRELDASGKLGEIIDLIRAFEGEQAAQELRGLIESLGPHRFIDQALGPLLEMVGQAWTRGDLEIRHEHYLSELLEGILRSLRRAVSAPGDARVVILATLPGEAHGLGMQIAAVLCSLAGARPQVLGTETPVAELVAAAREMRAVGVALSVSLATGGVQTDRTLRELRAALPSTVRLAVGGRGAREGRRGPRGVDYVPDRQALNHWIRSLP